MILDRIIATDWQRTTGPKSEKNIRQHPTITVSSCIINIDHNPLKTPLIVDNPLIHQLSHEKIISITGVVSSPSKKDWTRTSTSHRHVTRCDAGLCRRLPAAQRFVLVRRAGHGQGPGQEGDRDVAGGGEEAFQAETRNHGFFSWIGWFMNELCGFIIWFYMILYDLMHFIWIF